MKICNDCKFKKSLEKFNNDKRSKDGKTGRCKECQSRRNKENRERLREAHKRWKEKNPDYYKNYEKKTERKEYLQKWNKDNAEKNRIRMQKRRKDNPEKETEIRRKYHDNNREKINNYAKKWKEEKRETDIQYKIKENTSRRIRYELCTLLKGKKTKRTMEYLGCSLEELKEHLEKGFDKGMTWDNYGDVWHIDHIIPCKAWNLENEEDNLCCWNFRNLQPLYSSENQSKKDKYFEKDKEEYINSLKNLKII